MTGIGVGARATTNGRRLGTRVFVGAAALLVAGIVGCLDDGASTRSDETPAAVRLDGLIATIDGAPVLVGDLDPGPPALARAGEDGAERVDAAIARKLVAREARRRGLDEAPAIRAQIDEVRNAARRREEQVLREALYRSLYDAVAIDETALRAHWQETQSRYLERHYRFSRRILSSPEAARQLDASLGAAGRLDPALSEEIGPVAAHDLPREILPDALRLRAPGARAVIAVGDAGHLVELVEILPAVPRPLEEVKNRVEESLRNQRAQQAFESLIAKLRAEAVIDIDTEAATEAMAAGRR